MLLHTAADTALHVQGDPALPDDLTAECATLWDQSARLVGKLQLF
jgi:hypothetical protein